MFTQSLAQSFTADPILSESQQNEINSLLQSSKASNTLKAYNSDWNHFTYFCSSHNLTPLPAHPDTILLYITTLSSTNKLSTIKRHLAAINKAHTSSNHPSPTNIQTVKELLDGVARKIGNKQTPKKALVLDEIKAIIDCIDTTTLQGKRDKAILLLGFSTASRRSELVSINLQDLTLTSQGMDISIYEQKNNTHVLKSIVYTHNNYCPIQALNDWLDASLIKNNALFRSINKSGKIGERLKPHNVAVIVKKYVTLAGFDPTHYAGHSLRSGFATSAAMENFNTESIMQQTRHNTRFMVDRYVQYGNRFKNNASTILKKI
ncbi:site-specific integrase [Paenibacillus vulneris]|uniref:Site-specific integrase n=1 Tax=Paenibacillus vulneris TaxID=1133364 RepID=A0ABW3UIZ8_9BACL